MSQTICRKVAALLEKMTPDELERMDTWLKMAHNRKKQGLPHGVREYEEFENFSKIGKKK